MAICRECVHFDVCGLKKNSLSSGIRVIDSDSVKSVCPNFKGRSCFVELKHAEWIEDEDIYGDPIYRCSNCEARFVLEEGTPEDNEYYYCPTCGAKIQEQALKDRETDE